MELSAVCLFCVCFVEIRGQFRWFIVLLIVYPHLTADLLLQAHNDVIIFSTLQVCGGEGEPCCPSDKPTINSAGCGEGTVCLFNTTSEGPRSISFTLDDYEVITEAINEAIDTTLLPVFLWGLSYSPEQQQELFGTCMAMDVESCGQLDGLCGDPSTVPTSGAPVPQCPVDKRTCPHG
jgi:hypothetical protein